MRAKDCRGTWDPAVSLEIARAGVRVDEAVVRPECARSTEASSAVSSSSRAKSAKSRMPRAGAQRGEGDAARLLRRIRQYRLGLLKSQYDPLNVHNFSSGMSS
jgi:hypothetical protein